MAEDILGRIVATKRKEVQALLAREADFRARLTDAPAPRELGKALRREREVAVMAEVKRRSPGAGPIRPELNPTEVASAYEGAGAAAISVLTDGEYFGGSIQDLEAVRRAVSIPVFRKDFIIHPVQLVEARAAGADGTLLIARILTDEALASLHTFALELGLTPLVEVHHPDELHRALAVGAELIGINNRNLQTFTTNLEVTLDLLGEIPAAVTVVSESGIRTPAEVDRLGAAGVQGILVGETFLRAPDPGAAAATLVGRTRRERGHSPSLSVKICGLTRREDACLAADEGADYLGVVLVPGTPRAVSVSEAKELLSGIAALKVVVMANPSLGDAVEAANALEADVIQLHGEESPEFVGALRSRGRWEIWKALSVRGVNEVQGGLAGYGSIVDGLLLDGWHPLQRGGSGTSFSWEEVGRLRDTFPEALKLIAAGGLRPDNVEEAIFRLAPHVVDVSSGVEDRPGIKDPAKIAAFIRNARRASTGESR
jgi:indole-3-glycerol phosphate synthase/phosphoribosylanthranilate isomerase